MAAQEILIEKKDYLKPLDTKYAKLQEELLHLRELQYMTRYGDYLKIIPNQIRACAKSMKFENWETIGQNSFWDGYCTSHKRRIPKQRQLQDNTCCEKCLF